MQPTLSKQVFNNDTDFKEPLNFLLLHYVLEELKIYFVLKSCYMLGQIL